MHDRLLALLWPLLYVALGIAAGSALQQLWMWSVGRRVERRYMGLGVAVSAAGIAIFVCVALTGVYAATISYALPEHTLDFVRKVLLSLRLQPQRMWLVRLTASSRSIAAAPLDCCRSLRSCRRLPN